MAPNNVILGVGGGIAAYKAAELARALVQRDIRVQVVMTGGAQEFVRPLTFLRQGSPEDNGYARPIEGLVVRFDLDRMAVVDIEDHGPVPLPPRSGNYTAGSLTDPSNTPHFPAGPRADVRPIEITQPEGTSFTVEGHEIRWQKWRLRVGFTPREGLVLHTVGYEDQGRVRIVALLSPV